MTSESLTISQDTPFALLRRVPGRLSIQIGWNLILLFLIFMFLFSLAMPSLAKELMLMAPAPINRALPGMRAGLLTQAQGSVLRIDRATFTLAPQALIEDKFGTPLVIQNLQWKDVEFDVQYWLAPDQGPNQIMQMIVSFPE